MADKLKGSQGAKDFEKGFTSGGGNPFDFVYKMYQKVRSPSAQPSPTQQQSPAQQCPDCGQTIGDKINYPQGSS